MSFTYESDFVFMGKGDETFLENYSYELSEGPDARGGKIFMALEILNNQAEAEDIGEAMFSNFKQKFYENLDELPQVRFEEALKALNEVVETLKDEKVSHFIGNLNIAITAVVNDNLFLSTTGDAEVYLIRKRFVSVISEGLAEDSSKETFVNIANGKLEPSDTIVLSSSRLLRYITKGELGKIFTNVGPGRIGKSLADLHDFIMTEILGRSAVIGVYIAESEQEESEGEMWEETSVREPSLVSRWLSKPFQVFLAKLPWMKSMFAKVATRLPKLSELEKKTPRIPQIRFSHRITKERILIAVILLLVLLIGGVFWIRTRGVEREAIAAEQAKLNHARELINDASTTGQFDKPKAAELLSAAEKVALEVLSTRFLRAEAVKTLDLVSKQRDNLDEVKRISDPTVLADFSTKRSTVSALGLLALRDRLYGFEYNALYEIVLDSLKDPLKITDVETVIFGAAFADQTSLLFLTRTGKLIEYKEGRFSLISTKDGIWKKGVDMASYNDRLYILDPERNQIWRYRRQRDGFEAAEAYNQNAVLQKGVSLAIDSSIYILHSDGYITQLYQGQKQDYPLRKAPLVPVSAPKQIYTNPDLNYLFVLEPNKQRVVLFRKDPKNGGAQYHSQYVFEKTGELRDLLVADNRLYVMDDKKVYFVNLSGL